MTDTPRIGFAGTPDFAVPALEQLVEGGYPPVVVLTQPDRPAGRGRKPRPSPVKQCAQRHGLPVQQWARLDAEARQALAALQLDLLVVVAYGLILPTAVLALPRRGCVNIHASLLPRWRGAAPIQRAMLAGDADTGVCLMQMEAGLDTGPVLARGATPIHRSDTGASLHDRLAAMGAGLLMENLPAILDGSLEAEPQDSDGVTYASKLDKVEALVDWQRDAESIRRQIAAFNPWPVAQTTWQGGALRLWQADALADGDGDAAPGTVLAADADGIIIQCGRGRLRVLELQPPNGRPMGVAAFLNGRSLTPGVRLG
ncbi:methionyl-tRNA formyltransferase [Natronocella acetinitrilica]|uniref:Methionyl-tRNA formyltransferase n=1 Tax=Natronocella acetinitrilica TaxID=414046 RepID=A0AAE3KB92_9GAMM|nr:methionyl-tRNA formyltransferase [Natronocella acetinitrilica]MCP1673308.1 methionyl-tRNA formyltransferase [Natronocella acetinitrilica]